MARPKKYDRDQALEKARDIFWKNGYDALGVRAIEECTGLNRFAIQTDFGGKEGLFLEVLEKYAQDSKTQIIDPIGQGSIQDIIDFFKALSTPEENDPRIYGCLIVNTVVENANQTSVAIKEKTDAHYERLLNALTSALKNAKANNEIKQDINENEAALFLLNTAMGMQVYVRMKSDIAEGQHQTNMVINILESWRVS